MQKNIRTRKMYLGSFAKNERPTIIGNLPKGFVVNTDVRGNPGIHWIGIFVKKHSIYVFDSMGTFHAKDPTMNRLLSYLTKNRRRIVRNQNITQNPYANTCGFYCILFLLYMTNNASFHDFLNLFHKDLQANDVLICKLTKSIFPDISVPCIIN